MIRAQVIYLHLAVAATALTGVVFVIMKYGLESDDPFAVANHPMQPHMLSAHVIVAPVLVFGFGWIFSDHIWPKFVQPGGPNRASGLWSMAMIVPMTLSGYGLQVVTSDNARRFMEWTHWVTSGLFVVAYVVHLILKPKRVIRPED